MTYGQIRHQEEVEFSTFNFEQVNAELYFKWFDELETEAKRLMAIDLPLPAYDYILRANHTFNTLDARGAISVTERQKYIGRIRNLARGIAESFVEKRQKLGYPLLPEHERGDWISEAPETT